MRDVASAVKELEDASSHSPPSVAATAIVAVERSLCWDRLQGMGGRGRRH